MLYPQGGAISGRRGGVGARPALPGACSAVVRMYQPI